MNAAASESVSLPAVEPYLGLRPYTEAERNSFFGRNRERRLLIDKILANKLTLLFAASGVGKSSLLRAAVLPHLRHPKRENLDAIYYSDWVSEPLEGLKSATLAELKRRGRVDEQVSLQDMDAESLNDFFQLETLFTRHPLVIILDQFEEFFQYQRYAENFTPFIEQLSEVIRDKNTPIAVVISMREDFALELNAFKPHLPTLLFGNFYRLERLTVDCAREAIVEPVEQVGFQYEEKLLEAILKDLSTRELRHTEDKPLPELMDTVEPPYLQIVCSQLWQLSERDPRRTIALSTYREAGGAEGLLSSYVESVVGKFSPAEKNIASKCFDHLASRRGTKIAYAVGDLADIVGVSSNSLEPVLKRLESARILRGQSREDVVWYELYHDLFANSVSAWNRKYRAGQRNRRAVLMAMGVSLMAFLLYAAYNFGVNSTSYHLRLSSASDSSRVELYRGKQGSRDLFGLHRYVAQTGYRRDQLEPDKRFERKPVGSINDLDVELIENLTRLDRLRHYLATGRLDKARHLAEMYISGGNQDRAREVVEILESFPSRWSIQILTARLEADAPARVRDHELRKKIVEALGRMESAEARAALEELVNKPNLQSQVADAALRALAQSGDTRVLVRYLESDKPKIRVLVVQRLGSQRTQEAGRHLTAHLERERDPDVRAAVVKNLGAFDHHAAGPLMLELLSNRDESAKVRVAAAQGLGQLSQQPDGVADGLIEALGDQSEEVRAAASATLEPMADEALVPVLLDHLQELDSDKAVDLVRLLERLGDERAVDVLIGHSRSEHVALRGAAVEALGRLGDPRAVEVLAQSLDVVDERLRKKVESALVDITHPSATQVLIERLDDPRRDVRLRFAALLAEKGEDPRAAEAVLRLLGDPDEFLRSGWFRLVAPDFLNSSPDLDAVATVLTDMLEEPAWYARSNAMGAFWWLAVNRTSNFQQIGVGARQAAVAAVRRQLEDRDPLHNGGPMTSAENRQRMRFNAISALAALGDPSGTRLLLDVQVSDDWTATYRDLASQVLDRISGSAAAAHVVASELGEMPVSLRRHAIGFLGRVGSGDIAAELVVQLEREEDPELSVSLIEKVARLRAPGVGAALVARLRDADVRVRSAAVAAIGELDVREARAALIEALEDEDDDIRLSAALALGALDAPEGLPLLIERFVADDGSRTSDILTVLKRYRQPEVVSALISRLRALPVRSSARNAVAGALAQNGTPAAIEALLEGGDFAYIPIDAFVTVDNPATIQAVIRRLDNPEVSVRLRAAQILVPLREPGAVPGLIRLLDDKDPGVRSVAMDGLGRLRAIRALLPLTENLRHSASHVRIAAVKALGNLGDPKAGAPLMTLLDSQDLALRSVVLAALGELDDPRVLPNARQDLTHDTAQLRAAAAGVIGRLGVPEDHAALLPLLDDENEQVVTAAVRALGQLGSIEAIEELVEKIEPPLRADGQVTGQPTGNREVLLALGRIGGSNARQAAEEAFATVPDVFGALALLMLDVDYPMEFLRERIRSGDDKVRQEIAQGLDSVSSAPSGVFMRFLHGLVNEEDIALRMSAVAAIGEIASSESIEHLSALLKDSAAPERLRLAALEAMNRIDSDSARQEVRAAVEADDEILGATGYYMVSGLHSEDAQSADALSFMSNRLEAVASRYRESHAGREEVSGSGDAEDEAVHEQPFAYQWLYELGYCVARLAPNQGLELLSHDLVDVRLGAAAGLGSLADAALLERLFVLHEDAKLPLFRSSAYRAISHTLDFMEASGAGDQLKRLTALVTATAADEEREESDALRIRVEWAIAQLGGAST